MITLLAVGDLILDEPDPDRFFDGTRNVLTGADVAIGHVEVPHSTSTAQLSTDVPAPPADPAHVAALSRAGFDVVTLAGNHVFDVGEQGVLDTVRHCRDAGLVVTGAGPDLASARTPAVLTTAGPRVAVLSYNCVGPRESWATSRKAGCAYVRVLTHYELDHASPGGPPETFTFADPASLDAMTADVAAARAHADVVVVAFHKGVGHTPALIAMYERPVAHAAIDAGADVVIAHHAHILRGVEVYRGRPIYHGLGNFVTVTRALNPSGGDSAERAAWARKRVELYGFAPDPAMPAYPFHPESRNTVIASCRFGDDGALLSAGLIPCWIDETGAPQPTDDPRVAGYVEDITRRAGFDTTFDWEEGQIVLPATR
ncbi:CapA family protein [Cryptosporangium aurantiacum]|uniref:Poly-gamma-glutamate synthesis protein (Capsule biosynthesis protein) n=1 Tax=Cryptosporangium aurantiacum TaxID=134849 RepID=A0A1M7TVX8_9ACTN|nr:CapA family protein [Cryptosporangium aurantiacum]SHN74852.1 poly-gamma-glutamate synthesis protein (capsule biosynthesis protein) [Cryptosporangium aurantiacum]